MEEKTTTKTVKNGIVQRRGKRVDIDAELARLAPRDGIAPRAATKVIKLKSGVTVTWGIPSAQQQASLGVVQSVRRKPNGKEKMYPDEDGDTAAVIYYDKGKQVVIEILCASSLTVPDRGDVLSHDSESYLVEDCEENWQSEDCQKITVTAKMWENVSLAS